MPSNLAQQASPRSLRRPPPRQARTHQVIRPDYVAGATVSVEGRDSPRRVLHYIRIVPIVVTDRDFCSQIAEDFGSRVCCTASTMPHRDLLGVHFVANAFPEFVDRSSCVITGSVEPSVHHALDDTRQGTNEGRARQGSCRRSQTGRPWGEPRHHSDHHHIGGRNETCTRPQDEVRLMRRSISCN